MRQFLVALGEEPGGEGQGQAYVEREADMRYEGNDFAVGEVGYRREAYASYNGCYEYCSREGEEEPRELFAVQRLRCQHDERYSQQGQLLEDVVPSVGCVIAGYHPCKVYAHQHYECAEQRIGTQSAVGCEFAPHVPFQRPIHGKEYLHAAHHEFAYRLGSSQHKQQQEVYCMMYRQAYRPLARCITDCGKICLK